MSIVSQHPGAQYAWLTAGALEVAPALLGWTLVTNHGSDITSGYIVETEAYLGELDPASHAFRGRSARTAPMFLSGGHVYSYLSYGIHTCFNLVTGPKNSPQAVLVRALEPVGGLGIMAARRGITNPKLLTSGPGRLAQALGITRADSGTSLGSTIMLLPPPPGFEPASVTTGPRIGISAAKDKPWRFHVTGNEFVSRS